MGKLPPGVTINGPSLRIRFTHNGRREHVQLGLRPTPANIRAADRIVRDVRAAVRAGVFRWADFFPDSEPAEDTLFRSVAADWIQLKAPDISRSTRVNYERMIDYTWNPLLGERPVHSITSVELRRIIADEGWGPKRQNNLMTVPRNVFAHAIELGHRNDNPCDAIRSARLQRPQPDPFNLDEARAIIKWLERNAPGSVNYFRFAFFAGLRTSELIALQWDQVDLRSGIVSIDRSFVMGEVKPTKTMDIRHVELNSESRHAITAQKAATYLAGKHVFLDPVTGGPYVGDKPPRLVFHRALKALGIRSRPAYNTRHTYATVGLMSGNNPAWMARQLGHSLKMFMEVYARWIDRADHGRERDKIEAFITTGLDQSVDQSGGEQGG